MNWVRARVWCERVCACGVEGQTGVIGPAEGRVQEKRAQPGAAGRGLECRTLQSPACLERAREIAWGIVPRQGRRRRARRGRTSLWPRRQPRRQ